MSARLGFWFEFASTYSYPAALRLEALAAAAGVEVDWNAFLLGPIFSDQGLADSPFNLNPLKGRYMWRDLERLCDDLGLPFRRPSSFPRGSLTASRVAVATAQAPWLPAFVRAVYSANFAADRAIGEPAVIGEILTDLALPATELLNVAQAPAAKEALRAQVERARALGIFGAPSFSIGMCDRAELFWGNDRLEQALAWAARDAP